MKQPGGVALLLALVGCGSSPPEAFPDAATPRDLAAIHDLARPDLAALDLAAPSPDIAVAPDLAASPDGGADAAAAPSVLFVGAGDIAACGVGTLLGTDPHQRTARLISDGYPGSTPIFTLGDNVYSDGTDLQFQTCYDVAWGKFKPRTFPSPGNHDYNTKNASGYFKYFGARAGDPTKGYYAFDLGAWRGFSLNTSDGGCGAVPCGAMSAQVNWLRAELAASKQRCVMAYWHHPRFSSDRAGNNPASEPLYQALHDAGADLILVGHAHNYERFKPLTAKGDLDPARGIRQFVVGTGGADLRGIDKLHPHSELFVEKHGIMELTLRADSYAWRFIDTDGKTRDSGQEKCH